MTEKAIWLEIGRKDFVDAIRRLKPGRMTKSMLHREIQIGFIADEAVLCINGAETRRAANGDWPGFVGFNFGHALSYTKVQPIHDPVRLEFKQDRLRIETSRIPATWIDAPAWIASMGLNVHFLGPAQPPTVATMFCPSCGKKAGVLLHTMPVRARRTEIEQSLHDLKDYGRATYGCQACAHGWSDALLAS
jgi:hypothetical protein